MVSVWPEPPNARSAAPHAGVQLALLADWPYDDLQRPEVVSEINKPRQMVSLPGLGLVCESKLQNPDKARTRRRRRCVGLYGSRQDDRGLCPCRLPSRVSEFGCDDVYRQLCGAIFQKDMGPDTTQRAERMISFNPDQTWQKVTDITPLQ